MTSERVVVYAIWKEQKVWSQKGILLIGDFNSLGFKGTQNAPNHLNLFTLMFLAKNLTSIILSLLHY